MARVSIKWKYFSQNASSKVIRYNYRGILTKYNIYLPRHSKTLHKNRNI